LSGTASKPKKAENATRQYDLKVSPPSKCEGRLIESDQRINGTGPVLVRCYPRGVAAPAIRGRMRAKPRALREIVDGFLTVLAG
jgi:hypothetical protein